jgi:Periplasmic copper-binding protein (NosD)
MTKTAFVLALGVTALASMPAHAQQRVFASGSGLDTNLCTVTQPCRTFQGAYNIAPANSEIEVVDPAGYGPLTITHGISIQGHGFAGIFTTSGNAITVSVTTSDPVSLNGLLLDGGGAGNAGIQINSGLSVQILNSVIRHFSIGMKMNDVASTVGANLLIEDTIASDNQSGILVNSSGNNAKATLSRITANYNQFGVGIFNKTNATIANSVISNSSSALIIETCAITWLSKTVISGNVTGVVVNAATVNSYGDNYIRDNGTPVSGSLTPVTTQ